MLGQRSREAVEDILTGLHESYDGFDVQGETVDLDPDRYRRERAVVAEGLVAGVSVWIEEPGRGLLMVQPTEAPGTWAVPSFDVTPERPIEVAAAAHVRECVGVDCIVTDVDRVRRTRAVPADGAGPTLHRIRIYLDATVERGTPSAETDVEAVDWRTSARNVADATVAHRLNARGDGGSRQFGGR